MQNISSRIYYVDYMSYEGRLYELRELYEYFMNHLKSIELFEIKYFCLEKFYIRMENSNNKNNK